MEGAIDIVKSREKGTQVVSVKGRLDALTSPVLDKDLAEVISGGEKLLILDLKELDYVSSAGLRSILIAAKKLKAEQGRLLLASPKSVVKEVLDISGFSSIIPIFESVDAAVLSIG